MPDHYLVQPIHFSRRSTMSEGQTDDPFERELEAFERMRSELERNHSGRWVGSYS